MPGGIAVVIHVLLPQEAVGTFRPLQPTEGPGGTRLIGFVPSPILGLAHPSSLAPRARMEFSPNVQRLQPSATIAVSSLAKRLRSEGRDIIDLSAGEPDFDTPGWMGEAAVE